MSGRSALVAVALLAFASAGVFEARVIARQREELQALEKQAAETRRQAARLRRESDATHGELNAVEARLAATRVAATVDGATEARQSESNAWLARVKQLRRLFDERPDQRIPEMLWLTDDDWLRIAKRASFDDEHQMRKALGEVRAKATTNFAKLLNPALRKFALAANGEPPSSALALAPYFETTIDARVLERYEIVKGDDSAGIGPGVITIREKSPVDADYDSRRQASSNGSNLTGSSMGAPYAWIPDFRERSMRAFEAYVKANNGVKPEGSAPTLPYFNPPLEPAKAALILRFEQERGK